MLQPPRVFITYAEAFRRVDGTDELDEGREVRLEAVFLEPDDCPEGGVIVTLMGRDGCLDVVFDAGAAKTLGLGLQVLGDLAEADRRSPAHLDEG